MKNVTMNNPESFDEISVVNILFVENVLSLLGLNDGQVMDAVRSMREHQLESKKVELKKFVAVTNKQEPLITVLASNHDEADKRIEAELNKNPSRQAYYVLWVKDGRRIEMHN